MVQEGDVKMGDRSLPHVTGAFRHLKGVGERDDFEGRALILSRVHEMVTYLIGCEFGGEFRRPVDEGVFPGYRGVVGEPVDLGTVCVRLFGGFYCGGLEERVRGANREDPTVTQMDMVILEVLKDIERVYHNCFLFNDEGAWIKSNIRYRARFDRLIRRVLFPFRSCQPLPCTVWPRYS